MDYMTDALTTYRLEKGKINVTAGVTDRIAAVLGHHYVQSSGFAKYDSAKWKTTLKNLVAKLEIAVRRNVSTDGVHRQEIEHMIQEIKAGIKEYPETEPQAIVYLIFLAFDLMGDLPNNGTKRNTRENDFDLGRFRSIRYDQTTPQKARLILYLARWGTLKEYLSDVSDQELRAIESQYHRQKTDDFLKWFKGKYPTVYAELF